MALSHRAEREALIAAALRMNALAINQGTSGNLSVRIDGGLLITPSGVPYDSLKPKDIVAMDLAGGWTGRLKPSSEWRFHVNILAGRPEVAAIVHTHSTHATALACLRRGIPAFHYMVAVAGGPDIRCSDYATFGTAALSQAALRALDGRRACLLANHGVIATGASLDKALSLAQEVEVLAAMYLALLPAGRPALLEAAEMERVLNKFRSYGAQPAQEDRR